MEVKNNLVDILKKRAEGYETEEEVVEYGEGGEITKRKVTTKYVPPDLTALKLLLEMADNCEDIENMTTEQLMMLRKKLVEDFNENNIKDSERGGIL